MSDLQRLYSELVRLETELWNAIDARLRADHRLPLSRFEPMQIMARHPECRVGDIANGLAITIGGASKIVDRIEAAGYCRRITNPHDGRSSLIALTPAGQEVLAKATLSFEDELTLRLGAALSADALRALSATLSLLRAAGRYSPSDERVP